MFAGRQRLHAWLPSFFWTLRCLLRYPFNRTMCRRQWAKLFLRVVPPDHTAVVVKRELIVGPVAQCALVNWHVALEQLKVEWDEEAITEGISNDLWQRLNLHFRHRLESSLCFCYQRHRSPDNDHLPSLRLSSRDHCNSGRHHSHRWTSLRCR